MLVLMLCFVMQLDPDIELLTMDSIGQLDDKAITLLGFKLEEFDKKNKGKLSESDRRRKKKVFANLVKDYFKLSIPDDEIDDVMEYVITRRSKIMDAGAVRIFREFDDFRKDTFHGAYFMPKDAKEEELIISFNEDAKGKFSPVVISYTVNRTVRDDLTEKPVFDHNEIDAIVDGENKLTAVGEIDVVDHPARKGLNKHVLEFKPTDEQLHALFDNPSAKVAIRFGQRACEFDPVTCEKIHAWLTKNHPAFQDQESRE